MIWQLMVVLLKTLTQCQRVTQNVVQLATVESKDDKYFIR